MLDTISIDVKFDWMGMEYLWKYVNKNRDEHLLKYKITAHFL